MTFRQAAFALVIPFTLLLLAPLGVGLAASSAQADEIASDPIAILRWPTWQVGYELGSGPLGHFGASVSPTSPPGGFLVFAKYHLWYDHLLEGHLTLGIGVSELTTAYGAGFKLNLMELLDDPEGLIRQRGLQRGILAQALSNFMLFASVDFNEFMFPPIPAGSPFPYDASAFPVIPGLGVQWYFPFKGLSFARRIYLETSLSFANMSQNKYLLPYVGIGLEAR